MRGVKQAFRPGVIAECNQGMLWKIESYEKNGKVKVSNVNQPLGTYTAPVADLTPIPGLARKAGAA